MKGRDVDLCPRTLKCLLSVQFKVTTETSNFKHVTWPTVRAFEQFELHIAEKDVLVVKDVFSQLC